MSSKHQFVWILTALVAVIALVGCNAPIKAVEPTMNVQPTLDAVATQSAQTVVANLTQNAPTAVPATATAAPTETAVPTDTTVPTFTAVPATDTPTAVPWTATPKATATFAYSCTVNSTTPAFGTSFDKNAPFDGKWTVTNNAETTWDAGNVDFKYISGTKFQDNVDLLDLTKNVKKGDSYTVIIDMTAPKDSGRYSATWAFVQGSNILCPVYVTINVK